MNSALPLGLTQSARFSFLTLPQAPNVQRVEKNLLCEKQDLTGR
jgi:hypothetical protein